MSNLLDTPKLGFGCMRLPLTDPQRSEEHRHRALEEDGRCVHRGWRHVL